MISADIVLDTKHWNNKLKKAPFFFNNLLRHFPHKYQFRKKRASLTILLSNNKNIEKLNKKFRKKNKPTDILSFPFDKKPFLKKEIYLGDIIISYEFMNKPKSLTNLDNNYEYPAGLKIFSQYILLPLLMLYLLILYGYGIKISKQEILK